MSANCKDDPPLEDHLDSPRSSSPIPSSSSPSSSSDGSSSSSELNPNEVLHSPLTGLLNFEGFSMPQIRNFGISNIDMPNFANLPSLPNFPTLPSFNMPRFQPRLPDLTANLSNLQNLTTNMPNFPNLSYLSQLTNVSSSAELQNLFNLFRISRNFPDLPNFPQLPQMPQLPPFFSSNPFSRGQIFKQWPHYRDSVKNMHKRLKDIVQRVPSNFHFRLWKSNEGVEFVRIYFLLNESIHYCDSPLRINQHNSESSHDCRLLPSTSSGRGKIRGLPNTHTKSSKHEIFSYQPLQPKNLIIGVLGDIESYEYDQRSSRFVFSIDKSIYYFDDHPGKREPPHVPTKVESGCSHIKIDPKICPSNADLVSYYCQGEIKCVNLKTFKEVNLTDVKRINSNYLSNRVIDDEMYNSNTFSGHIRDINDSSNYDAAPILVGKPSLAIQEEFRRNQAFWWGPETDYHIVNDSEDYSEYQLLYEETDQSKVAIVRIPSWNGISEEQRYPRPGANNAISSLKLVKFKLSSKDGKISDIVTSKVSPDFKKLFSDYEYLLKVGWLGQEAVWCQLMNRAQNHLVIVLISLSGTFESQIIYEERNDALWIGVHDILWFLEAPKLDSKPLSEGSELVFIWSSDETGYRHLYLVKFRLGKAGQSAKMIFKKRLTDGPWEVDQKDLWVNEKDMLIYFTGLKDTTLEKHLYVLSYAGILDDKHRGKIKMHRLTELNYCQTTIAFDSESSLFVNVQSNITTPPFGFVNIITHHQTKSKRDNRRLPDCKRLGLIQLNPYNHHILEASHLDYLKSVGNRPSIIYDCQLDLLPGLTKPELFCCQLTSGDLIYGSVFKPEFMEPGVRYPTVLEVYGGPGVQLVSNNFLTLRRSIRHLLSSEGYVVVVIDGRGSGGRGKAFEAFTHWRLGQLELADQIEVLEWLAKNTGYIDLTRVAVMGSSYGGYLALMALANYPKVFKIAIANAPLTNWHMYDSAYTERYLGSPVVNPDGYYKGNVLNYVHMLPDQASRLLILHGLKDENVHFSHSVALINALIEVGKPYDLQIFPTERHIFKKPMPCVNYMTCILSYLQLNL